MRIRYLKNTEEILAQSALVEAEPCRFRGAWRAEMKERMGCEPEGLYVEIGCGMGGFIRQMAERDPAGAYIGVERLSTILARAAGSPEVDNVRTANVAYSADNREAEAYPNLRLVREEAEYLGESFAPGEVDAIFLNFSDPWPKERHAKRRLTSERHLAVYRSILKRGGVLRFKTDNDALFAYSVQSLCENGWRILAQTDDLHAPGEPLSEGNCITEYEAAFMKRGKQIHCLEAVYGE